MPRPRAGISGFATCAGARFALTLAVALLVGMALPSRLPAATSADDVFVGTWTLDPRASHYVSRDMPARMVIVMDAVPGGIHYKSKAVRAGRNGMAESSVTAEYTADYDGKLAMVLGNSGIMAPVQLHRLNARSVAADYVRGFQRIARSVRVVSADGATMTITTTSTRDDAKTVVNVGVYRRAGR